MIEIYLEAYRLQEIKVVYNNKFKSRKDQPPGTMTIDAGDISEVPLMAGEPDLLKYLAMQSGVASGVEGYSQVSVRGGGPGRLQEK